MFPERIETDRLVLERLCHENVAVSELYDLLADDEDVREALEHVPQTPYQTMKEAHDKIEKTEEHWADRDVATYAVRPDDDEDGAGKLAGTTSLSCKWERQTAQFGLILMKPFWGRGYSGERAAALMELAFDQLDFELVSAGYNEGNEKSKRAIEKYVDTFDGQYDGVLRNRVPMEEGIDDLHVYTIMKEQYNQATKSQDTQCRFIYG